MTLAEISYVEQHKTRGYAENYNQHLYITITKESPKLSDTTLDK